MNFHPPLVRGRLLQRYKRFLADVILDSGETVTAHCPNTGAMTGCAESGMTVWLSRSDKPGRKYPYGWELVELPGGVLVGIHTGRANALVAEGLDAGLLPTLAAYPRRRPETVIPGSRCRADFLLTGHDEGPDCWLEVKNVTAAVRDGLGFFPDSPTERGRRHVEELIRQVEAGNRAALVFCVQRADVEVVTPARDIDPAYADALARAMAAGVEVHALGATVAPQGIRLQRVLKVHCP